MATLSTTFHNDHRSPIGLSLVPKLPASILAFEEPGPSVGIRLVYLMVNHHCLLMGCLLFEELADRACLCRRRR